MDLTCQNTQEGGLSAAVGTQQPDPLPRVHLKGEPVQYFFADLELLHKAGY